MRVGDRLVKRLFDVVFALAGLLVFWPLILLCWLVSSIETRSNGIFVQERIGRFGASIKVFKIKTMYDVRVHTSAITALNASRITASGVVFRRYKLDELPQLWNVLIGEMSFVGPRPDVRGYADKLVGDDSVILLLRPGITGPASLKYRNEEEILLRVRDPAKYNDTVIWPDKVRINKQYYFQRNLYLDLKIIWSTISAN